MHINLFPECLAQSKGQNTALDVEILGCSHATIICLSYDLGSVHYTKSRNLVVQSLQFKPGSATS